jgi:hypothetical protein
MAFAGMRGTGDWATDQRPKNWRETILFLYPNGDAPLTALLSKMKEERVDDPEFNWWTKSLPTQRATLTGDAVYTDALSTAYTTGGAAGDTLYCRMAAADVVQFRPGHQVLLRNSSNYLDDANAKVTDTVQNGATSYIVVKLLEADPTTTGLADADTALVIGNINAEGAAMPDAVAYDPTKLTNYTQIFRTPLEITRTARRTRLRTGDAYKEAKREALELHSIEMEKAYIWGIKSENTGDNGKPERTTGGLIEWITDNSGIVSNYVTETNAVATGRTWDVGGEEWLDWALEQIFRYGSDERMAFCGSGVILGINKLIKLYGNYQLIPKTTSYGIRVMEWVTPFGILNMKRHPLFSYEATNRNTMVVFEPSDLRYRYIDDTSFYDDPEKKNTGYTRRDGTKEEYLTECGLEFHHPSKCGYLNGFNSDNTN